MTEMIVAMSFVKMAGEGGEVGVLRSCMGEGKGWSGSEFEGERAWLEVDQLGQLGFRRVSCSGISRKVT